MVSKQGKMEIWNVSRQYSPFLMKFANWKSISSKWSERTKYDEETLKTASEEIERLAVGLGKIVWRARSKFGREEVQKMNFGELVGAMDILMEREHDQTGGGR